MKFSIFFAMAADRGELNGIFCLACNVYFKVCVLLWDGKVAFCHFKIDIQMKPKTKLSNIPGGVCLNAGSCSLYFQTYI